MCREVGVPSSCVHWNEEYFWEVDSRVVVEMTRGEADLTKEREKELVKQSVPRAEFEPATSTSPELQFRQLS